MTMPERREFDNQKSIQALNNQLTAVLVMLEQHSTTLDFIKNQTTQTNGRVSFLEGQMRAVEPAIQELEGYEASRRGALAERRRYLSQLALPFLIAIILAILQTSGIIDINFSI